MMELQRGDLGGRRFPSIIPQFGVTINTTSHHVREDEVGDEADGSMLWRQGRCDKQRYCYDIDGCNNPRF